MDRTSVREMLLGDVPRLAAADAQRIRKVWSEPVVRCRCECGCHNTDHGRGCRNEPEWVAWAEVWACSDCLATCDEADD